jgi:hypothetical protein
MELFAANAALAFVPPATVHQVAAGRAAEVSMGAKEELAFALNPAIGYFDPLNLGSADFWSKGNDATYGFLRQAEIKHGRVAMAAFVGYIVQANGIKFPWETLTSGATPEEKWFNLPIAARAQIIGFIGFLEWWSEFAGESHYMKGGKPGAFPSFGKDKYAMFHPVPFDLYDPFGLSKKRSEEDKAVGLLKEINNGRLAMIGIMGFMAEAKVEGSVPALTGLIKHFDGDVMIPFA